MMNAYSTLVISAALGLVAMVAFGNEPQFPPRIDSVVMLERQPHENSPATIWYDDFNSAQEKRYAEQSGGVDRETAYGGAGGSMRLHFPQGHRGIGNRKVFFGDAPTGNPIVRRGEHFREIYWRIYVRHQHGWQGGSPAKMSRATSIVANNWAQGMIAHVWNGGQRISIDPATGIRDNRIVSTRYNDFANLNWMGARTTASFPLHSPEESGYWVKVEARAKLNTPGQSDAEMQLWIDGRLEAELKNMNWHGTYTGHGINALFLEAYWNDGSPVEQTRWYDNFVISTEPIGPIFAPRNAEVIKSVEPGRRPGTWQIETAAGDSDQQIVWRSGEISGADRVRITAQSGEFLGALSGQQRLAANELYYLRIRRQNADDTWSNWSHWHQPFRTAQ